MNKMNIKKLIISLVAALGLSAVTSVIADGHKYTVDSSNYTEYTDMLSPGQLTMFSAYPDTYKIHVYETVVHCQIPPEIKAISQTNGTMVNDNEGIEVPNMGQVPFPNPYRSSTLYLEYEIELKFSFFSFPCCYFNKCSS